MNFKDKVCRSTWKPIWDSTFKSVQYSVRDTVRDYIWNYVFSSVRVSDRDHIRDYIDSKLKEYEFE